ncbi:hypothetical protein [Streptomyces sp. NPDC007369]|uniref:hypothetical protein n=1 Tax=Streptomyces sp. NPDC007369 TaxID=3154589 RepID=UPI0033FD3580
MSDKDPVDPAEVPVFTGDLVELDKQVKAISSGGAAVFSAKAGDVHSSSRPASAGAICDGAKGGAF